MHRGCKGMCILEVMEAHWWFQHYGVYEYTQMDHVFGFLFFFFFFFFVFFWGGVLFCFVVVVVVVWRKSVLTTSIKVTLLASGNSNDCPSANEVTLNSLSGHGTGLILGLRPANKRRRYFVTTSLIGWAQT